MRAQFLPASDCKYLHLHTLILSNPATKYVLGRGLPSSEKLAEYWFLTV